MRRGISCRDPVTLFRLRIPHVVEQQAATQRLQIPRG